MLRLYALVLGNDHHRDRRDRHGHHDLHGHRDHHDLHGRRDHHDLHPCEEFQGHCQLY